MKLLADTSALLALVLADDSHHEAATRFARKSPQVRFVMTELILSEVVTRLRARAGAARAVAFADDALGKPPLRRRLRRTRNCSAALSIR